MICYQRLLAAVLSPGSESASRIHLHVLNSFSGFFNKATEDAVFSNVIDLLFNCAAFIYIGAIIPFDSFNDTEYGVSYPLPRRGLSLTAFRAIKLHVWRLVLLAICVLLFRRLPILFALYKFIPDVKSFREAAFTGWFGESPFN